MPKIGEGFGEWFEILLRIRRTKEVVTLQGDPAIVWHAICITYGRTIIN